MEDLSITITPKSTMIWNSGTYKWMKKNYLIIYDIWNHLTVSKQPS